MPVRGSKNVVQKVIEFPPELAEEVERFAEGRELTFKAVVLRALRRHLDSPPPHVPDPPLPPCEPDSAPAPKPAKKPRAKKGGA